MPRLFRDLRERFDEKIYRAPSGCWIWLACLNGGYGVFATRRSHQEYAHRLVLELLNREEIPPGMEVDHLCRVRRCVNPLHLEIVTPRVNTNRRPRAQAQRMRCPSGHPYEGDNLLITTDRQGNVRRTCLTCRRRHVRASHAKARARMTSA